MPSSAPSSAPLAPLTTLHWDAPSDALAAYLLAHTTDEAYIVGLREGAAAREGADRAWLLVGLAPTSYLIEHVTQSDHYRVCEIDPRDWRVHASPLGRDSFAVRDETVLYGSAVGGGSLRPLAQLAALEPPQRALALIKQCADAKEWDQAAEIVCAADEEIGWEGEHNQDAPTVDIEGDASRTVRAPRTLLHLWGAYVASSRAREEEAIAYMTRASEEAQDDLLTLSREEFGKHSAEMPWRLMMAMAHEAATQWTQAASVYASLASEDDVFSLQQARALERAGRASEAIDAYDQFIRARAAQDVFVLEEISKSDTEETSADPDLIAACLEAGSLMESRGALDRAARTYLLLIRHAPLYHEGYERLFSIEGKLGGSDTDEMHVWNQIASAIIGLLSPARRNQIVAHVGALPTPQEPGPIPPEFEGTLDDATHDEVIIHRGERARRALAQKWLSGLLVDAHDTGDIERHCQLVHPSTHPDLWETIQRTALCMGVTPPRCYLSHGMTGARVLGHEREPFLLLGAAHLDPAHAQYMAPRQQAFAIGAQLEHIRARHLMLTNSEFWRAFGDRALTGTAALLSFIPVGGMIGKFLDGIAGGVLTRLKSAWDNPAIARIARYAERQIQEGAAPQGVQTAYEATLARATTHAKQGVHARAEETSMVKEQLANFARCALYTADRMGLVVCDDLEDAVRAILLSSPRTAAHAALIEERGLHELLSERRDGALVYGELAMRLGELFSFALSDEHLRARQAIYTAGSSEES